jgi:1,4-dihydroxy-2-naphthoyl-CoA hydrolase
MDPLTPEQLAEVNARSRATMAEALQMEFISASDDGIVVRMPITDAARQPFGILHGGATVALCETAASMGTYLGIDQSQFTAVGLEINCNHIRATPSGVITATAVPVHRGRTTWVWDIRVHNEEGKLVAMSRCTIAIVPNQR